MCVQLWIEVKRPGETRSEAQDARFQIAKARS